VHQQGDERGRKAFRSVFRIRSPLAANAAQLVVHPVIHVEDKLSDGVRKSFNLARGQFGGKILDAGDGISVRAFAVQQFSRVRAKTWKVRSR
jgi:hypothetical protein